MHSHTGLHPIMAYLEKGNLDIKDDYVTTSSSKPATTLHRKDEGQEPFEVEPKTCVIDESMKTFIKVTAIWVALRQGLSPSFKYNEVQPLSPHGRSRSQSYTPVSSYTSLTPSASCKGSIRKCCSPTLPTNRPPQFDGTSSNIARGNPRLPGIPSTVVSDGSGERALLETESAKTLVGTTTLALLDSPSKNIDFLKPSRWRRIKDYGRKHLMRRKK